MAAGKINLQKESGGIVKISPVDGIGITEVTVPESGNLVSVDTAVTDNSIARYDGATGKLQNSSVIIDDNNNVGIGTSSPDSRLHIASSGVTTLHLENILSTGDGTHDVSIQGYKPYVGYSNAILDFSSYIFKTSAHERMRIASSGNLLVGTTTDNGVDKLQVNGSMSSGTIQAIDSGDLNNYVTRTQVIGTYPTMSNIPINDHGYLEVIVYAPYVWVMQRFTTLGATGVGVGRVFVRCLVNGTWWSAWVEK